MKKTYTMIGAVVGFVLFLAVALLPTMVYGGYAGVLLAGGIFGAQAAPTLAARALIVFGMSMGVFGAGSLFTVLGAIVGAAVQAISSRSLSTASAHK